MDSFEQRFSDLGEFYPGSKQRRLPTPPPTEEEGEIWLSKGKSYSVSDKEVLFFPISALALALGKSTATIYSWENKGWLPKPRFRGKHQGMGGRRRLYTARQIREIVKICNEEGLLGYNPPSPGNTRLYQRATEVFMTL